MRSRARQAFLGAILSLVAALPAAQSHAADDAAHRVTAVFEFARVTAGRTHLSWTFSNGTAGHESAGVFMWSLAPGGNLVAGNLIVTPGGHLAPETNVTGTRTGCMTLPSQPAVVCESRVGGFAQGTVALDTSRRTDPSKLVVAFVGDDRMLSVRLDPTTRGWRMKRISRHVGIRRTQDADASYAISESESIEHFRGAFLSGGRRGSLAMAALPCRELPLGLVTGHGTAVLTGGAKPALLACSAGKTIAYATARLHSTWHVRGEVTGTTSSGIQVTSQVHPFTRAAQDFRLVVVHGPF